jgi:hypothetical protein
MNYYNFISENSTRPELASAEPVEVITPTAQDLHLGLDGFTTRGYAVAILREDYGLSFMAIAQRLGISESTARLEYAAGVE